MDNMNLPPKPTYKPDNTPRTEQERRMPRGVKIGAGSVAFALLMGGGVLLGKKMSEREDEGIDTRADPTIATASQDPTESPTPTKTATSQPTPEAPSSSPGAIPQPKEAEPTLSPSTSLEMSADYESPLNPERLAKQYFEARNDATMLGCNQELIDEYQTFSGTQDDTAHELVSSKGEERREIIGEQMGGPAWEDDLTATAWVDARVMQNANACTALLHANEQGKSYTQTDTLDGPVEVTEEIEMMGGTRIITLDAPVHTQALVDGEVTHSGDANDTNYIDTWDYKFTASLSLVVHGKESGESVGVSVDGKPGQVTVLGELYGGERYDIVKEPSYVAYADN